MERARWREVSLQRSAEGRGSRGCARRALVCRGTLCGIFISGHPPEGDTWSSTASGLYEALIGKYGQPSQRDLRIPAHCGRTDGAASAPAGPDCIESGHASLRATWTWPTARRIEVFVGIPDGAREPSVELSYTSPRVDTGAEGL